MPCSRIAILTTLIVGCIPPAPGPAGPPMPPMPGGPAVAGPAPVSAAPAAIEVTSIEPADGAALNAPLRRIVVRFSHPIEDRYLTTNEYNGNVGCEGAASSVLVRLDAVYDDGKRERGLCYGMALERLDDRTVVFVLRQPIGPHTFDNGGGDPNVYTIVAGTIAIAIGTSAYVDDPAYPGARIKVPVRDVRGVAFPGWSARYTFGATP